MKYLFLVLALMVAGCAKEPVSVTTHKLVGIAPPPNLYRCPSKPTKPNPDTLKDSQVAGYIARMDRAYSQCANSNKALKSYSDQAEKRINSEAK